MRLHWVSLTCAQVGLKRNSNEASPNSLISDLWAIAQLKGLRPNNAKSPPTFKLATPLRKSLVSYAPKIKDNAKYEFHAIIGKVKASHAAPAQLSKRCQWSVGWATTTMKKFR